MHLMIDVGQGRLRRIIMYVLIKSIIAEHISIS